MSETTITRKPVLGLKTKNQRLVAPKAEKVQ
jgi:hypothetical protein